MRPEILITIITSAIVSIFIWEAFRMFYRKFIVEEPIKHYQPDRHEYPKKEEVHGATHIKYARKCDNPQCLDGINTSNGLNCNICGGKGFLQDEEPTIKILRGREIPNPEYVYPKKDDIQLPPNFKWIDECNEVNNKVNDILDKRARIQSDIDIHRLDVTYPKKDCECDCLGECKTLIKGADIPEDEYLSERKFLRETHPLTVNIPGRFTSDENILMTTASCKLYMSRHNRRYFRGENIKVVVTVKGGDDEKV